MILVIGATGTNGRGVVRRLAAVGRQVRALVRNPAKADGLRLPKVEPAAGDLGDPTSLDRAFEGVSRAFVVTAVDRRAGEWFRDAFDAAKPAGFLDDDRAVGLLFPAGRFVGAEDDARVAPGRAVLALHEGDALLRTPGEPLAILAALEAQFKGPARTRRLLEE